MTPERWRQITGIFNGAVAIADAAAREAYLHEACGNDPSLRAEIDSLLSAHGDLTSSLDAPLPQGVRARTPLAAGTRLGPYLVEDLLGAGGMGEVYRARDTRLGRTVALKILPAHLRAKPLLARFEREARTVAGINHPHICTLYDVGRHEDIDFLVMELVEGETLSSRLERGPLSITEAISLAREVAEALAAAHGKGIIHRDIKPSNIIVTPAGHVKVVDFGLARESSLFQSAESTRDDPTEPGVRVGTPRYMSPEQALGQPLDPRTDLFSLGVVLFECLTGELPFAGKTRFEYLQNLLSGSVKSAVALRPETPPALQAVLARCLERDASKRLDSATWLATELERLGHVTTGFRLAHWATGIAVAAAIIAAVGGVLFVSSRNAPVAPTNLDVPQLRRFTTSPGEEVDSHFSPDGMWMSFVSTRDGQSRLYAQQVDGGEARQVSLPAGEIQSHLWSPDQRAYACLMWQDPNWIVQIVPALFGGDVPLQSVQLPAIPRAAKLLRWIERTIYVQVEESGQPPSLRRLDLQSGGLESIAGPWTKMRVRSFDVKPDGLQVVWTATASGTQRDDLWVADLRGGPERRLTPEEDDSRKRFPLWNEVGTRVIYQSARGGQVDLWELDVATLRSIRVTTDAGIERPESASRDGSLSYQVSSERTALVVWGNDRAIEIGNEGLSDFAPDASRTGRPKVAYQRSQPSPVEGFLQMDSAIFVGDMTAPISVLTGTSQIATGIAPRLSPDGKLVAYLQRRHNPTSRAHLMISDVESRLVWNPSSLMVVPGNNGFPVSWSEQTVSWGASNELYFAERTMQPERSRIVHYRVGEQPAPLLATETINRIADLYPSSNGKKIAYLTRSASQGTKGWDFQLHVADIVGGTDRIVANLGSHYAVRLRGWLQGDAAMVVARSLALEPGQTWTFELMTVSIGGDVKRSTTIDHVVSLSQLSTKRSELFFTRSISGVGDLFAYSFATHMQRQVTHSTTQDVTFGGAAPLGEDYVIGIRHEQTRDIHWMDARPRPKPGQAK